MKNKESVVMSAVQQNGRALICASEDMKNQESVVMAAVQQKGSALEYASEDMKKMISNGALKFGIDVQQYVRAVLNPKLVQVQVSKESGTQDLTLTCHNLGGIPLATVTLQPEDDEDMLRQKIADAVHPPHGRASLNLVLPCGQLLRNLDISKFLNADLLRAALSST